MLLPAEIILDSIIEDRADIPINAIYMYSGLKADLYSIREADELRHSTFQRRERVDYGPPIGTVYIHSPEDFILYKLLYFGLSHQSNIQEILQQFSNQRKMNLIWTISSNGQLA